MGVIMVLAIIGLILSVFAIGVGFDQLIKRR
jgi:NhaP-type Na+/H+ or K+/H+ antiporter